MKIQTINNNEISILTEQKTVEDLAEEMFPTTGKIEDYRELEANIPKQEGFIAGYNKAKSEQKQSYSREEIIELLQNCWSEAVINHIQSRNKEDYLTFTNWIEQNLK
jgi:hypothetical protein